MKRFIVALFVISILSINIDANAAGRASSKSYAPAATKAHVASKGKAKAERAEPGFFSSAFGDSKSYGNAKAHSAFGSSSNKSAAKAAGPARSAWAK